MTIFASQKTRNVGITPAVALPTDTTTRTIIGLSISNLASTSITISAYINDGTANTYIIKNTAIPNGNSLSILKDSKIIINSTDSVYVNSSTANSADIIVSYIKH